MHPVGSRYHAGSSHLEVGNEVFHLLRILDEALHLPVVVYIIRDDCVKDLCNLVRHHK